MRKVHASRQRIEAPNCWTVIVSDGPRKADWWDHRTRREARAVAREMRASGYREVRTIRKYNPNFERQPRMTKPLAPPFPVGTRVRFIGADHYSRDGVVLLERGMAGVIVKVRLGSMPSFVRIDDDAIDDQVRHGRSTVQLESGWLRVIHADDYADRWELA